jgi:hypothetical protein
MLSKYYFTYYQPQYENGDLPAGLFSFQAFPTKEECEEWLKNNGYEPGDFVIHEYCDDEIEDVTLIDANGNVIPKIEALSDEEIEDLLTDQVLLTAGSIDNLHATRQSDETEDQFKDRVYTEALDQVNAAIESIEKSGDYDFSSYCNNPDTEWYDEARDEAVRTVMDWMLEDYPY